MAKCLSSFLTAAVVVIAGASSALACDAVQSDAARSSAFDGSNTDMALLNESFIAEVNAHRCDHGLAPLTYDAQLEQASTYHSGWMSRETVFAHESTEPGMEAPWGRALQFGYRYQTVAENLALHPRFAFNEQPFYVTGTCTFKSTTGDVIAPSTYAQLAHEVGVGWMNSPPAPRKYSFGRDNRSGRWHFHRLQRTALRENIYHDAVWQTRAVRARLTL